MTSETGHVPDLIPAALREMCPPVCPECDYSLVGLPPGSRCPECGALNDAPVVSLQGYSTDSWVTMRPRDLIWVAAGFVPLLIMVFYEGRRGRSVLPMLSMLLIVAAVPAVKSFRHWFLRAPTSVPVRLRMGPGGFEQRVGPGPLNLTPWDRDMIANLRVRRNGRHTLSVNWTMRRIVLKFKPNLILFDFDATREQAVALRQQIDDWIIHGL